MTGTERLAQEVDAIRDRGLAGAFDLATFLAKEAAAIEASDGDQGSRGVVNGCRMAMLEMMKTGQWDGAVQLTLSQVMKGNRFANILTSGAAISHTSDEKELELQQVVRKTLNLVPERKRRWEQLLVTPATESAVEAQV